nr:hydroxyacyl coenzyme a dehydrogenase [Hymenolepis microstoma]
MPVLSGVHISPLIQSFVRSISNVAVIGSGQMGSGIAAICGAYGYKVKLFDCDGDQLEKSVDKINKILHRMRRHRSKNFVEATMSKIELNKDINDTVSDSDLVIESITEDLKAKRGLFHSLEGRTPKSCLFATNTSSISVNEIVETLSQKASFCGLHFFNPVDVMKLVEIIKCQFTSDGALKSLIAFAESLNKTVVQCKDTPGFIVNRLLIPYLLEAVEMWERGEASIESIDLAMRAGAGHPMGPFELADHVGLDTIVAALEYWTLRYPDERVFRLSQTLRQLVVDGRLGKKVGHGFFVYNQNAYMVKK